MSQTYQKRPSEIADIEDSFTAFCFDEACAFIKSHYDDKNQKWLRQPLWSDKSISDQKKKYNKRGISGANDS